jgi:hypothetical protein
MPLRLSALVVFGAATSRPTIVCIHEDALPANPGDGWLVLARESDIFAAGVNITLPLTSDGSAEDGPPIPTS